MFDNSLAQIALTVAAFAAGHWFYRRSSKFPAFQPVLIAIVILSILMIAFRVPSAQYLENTRPLHFLLGPAIVALAVPLYENLRKVRSAIVPLVAAVLLGGTWVTGSALALGVLLRLDRLMELSLATKSVTVPIAVVVAAKIGGAVSLTVISCFITGVSGVVITPLLLRWIGVRDPVVGGFTLGLTSHVFGIARSVELGPTAVVFATLAMVMMGCLSGLIIPLLFRFL